MIPISVAATGRTHIGLVRQRNEDSLYVGRSLFAVADGLGGHVAGDVASTTAIETLERYDRPVDPADLADILGQAVSAVNEALGRKTAGDSGLVGMGTTLVALLRSGSAAVLANIGDSRAYLHRLGRTAQITEDHTYGHLLADAMSVPHLPERLSRFLDGRTDGRSPDLISRDLRPGDRFLLCSDGLSSYVPHDLVHATLNSSATSDVAADRLIDLALDQGGIDNVTVIVIDVYDDKRDR